MVAQYVGWRAPLAIYPIFACYIMLLLLASRIPQAKKHKTPIKNGLGTALRSAWPVHLAPAVIMIFIAAQGALLPFHLAATGLTEPNSRAIVLTATPTFAMIASTTYGLIKGRISDRWLFSVASYFPTAAAMPLSA